MRIGANPVADNTFRAAERRAIDDPRAYPLIQHLRARSVTWRCPEGCADAGSLANRIAESGCCVGPDVDVPSILCGHPLPCPRHPNGVCCGGTGRAFWDLEDRLTLLAYCGDERAVAIIGETMRCGCYAPAGTQPPCFAHTQNLGECFRALSRWGDECLTRAACVAARHIWAHGPKVMPGVIGTITAAERWIADPTKMNRKALHAASGANGGERVNGLLEFAWLCAPAVALRAAAREMDHEPAIRTAVCTALCEWALGEGSGKSWGECK